MLAVQKTLVSPVEIRQEPSAYFETLISIEQGRGSNGDRSVRVIQEVQKGVYESLLSKGVLPEEEACAD